MKSKQTLSIEDNRKEKLLEPYKQEEIKFLDEFPDYIKTKKLDDLRQTDFERLNRLGQVYLDYTGAGLYGESQLKEHLSLLSNNVFGNPHSSNPTSLAATKLVDRARAYVLKFFNASADEYVCIFTKNASESLKLVGESYPFGDGNDYLLTFDNHNSVNGIREFARAKGAKVSYIPMTVPELRMDKEKTQQFLKQKGSGKNHLFAYPAQSNLSGVQHSLDWIETAQAEGWDVLLDGAAFVPTNRLDLSQVHPDFVSLSFYKMFGYPTGVGALLARRAVLQKLNRPWFAGGTITVASVQGDKHFLHSGSEGFEDGTLNFLTLPAIEIGLRYIEQAGIETIHQRVTLLTGWLLNKMTGLRHNNGKPVVSIYGPKDIHQHGGTISFNFFDQNGHFIDHLAVERKANQRNISLRTGCFCNPGGGEQALGLSPLELKTCFGLKPAFEYQDLRECIIQDKSTGAVRISVGLASTFKDVYEFIDFAQQFVDKDAADMQ